MGQAVLQAPQALLPQPGSAVRPEVVLPTEWLATLQAPANAPEWRVDPQQQWVQHTAATAATLYRVQQDGSLTEAVVAGPPVTGQWAACCVVDVSRPLHPVAVAHQVARLAQQQQQQKQQQQEARQEQEGLQRSPLYLVGPYTAIQVDPSVVFFSVWICYTLGSMQTLNHAEEMS